MVQTKSEAVAQAQADQYEIEVLRDVRIPTIDPAASLSADVWLPVETEPIPAIVMVLPYRKDAMGVFFDASFRWLAERGYACLLVDLQGTGSSDGEQRAPMDPNEGDDAVAAIEWAAAQPWCTGDVGMWGLSYGGLMSMRAASRCPPHLKAIIPMMGPHDVERDAFHQDGVRGDLFPLAVWGGQTLALQLMPPLLNYMSANEQRRWRQRLHEAEPFVLDVARHGPGDPVWRSRAVDPKSIMLPTLCVGGWWDNVCEAMVCAYEQIQGPKKLLIGPWMHTMPQDSPFEAIDFLSLALRWWDHWLRGVDNGVMDEPPVTLYVQGANPEWRAYQSWPPTKEELVLATRDRPVLEGSRGEATSSGRLIAKCRPDPTSGTLSGLWPFATSFGLPLDQHDDDARALPISSEPLPADLIIGGRPRLSVRLADDDLPRTGAPARIVAKLTEVDPQGHSSLIAVGVTCCDDSRETQRITMRPTTYRVHAGSRLRVVLSDADFPRFFPPDESQPLKVAQITLTALAVPENTGTVVEMGIPAGHTTAAQAFLWGGPRWRITRDPVEDGVEVAFGSDFAAYTLGQAHLLEWQSETQAAMRRYAPEAAVGTACHTALTRMSTGETITVTSTVRITRAALWAHGEVNIDGTSIFTRIWDVPLR